MGSSAAAVRGRWWFRVTSFAIVGQTRVLRDADGARVARLIRGGRPTPGPDVAASEAETPTVTGELRQQMRTAAPLRRGLSPANHETLLGRWVSASATEAGAHARAYLQLTGDGLWSGSDGCNATGGAWVSGTDGAVLAVGGPSALVYCGGMHYGTWLTRAARAGFDGVVLVLVDPDGHETGRLRPA